VEIIEMVIIAGIEIDMLVVLYFYDNDSNCLKYDSVSCVHV
jgi:hypothetical protein